MNISVIIITRNRAALLDRCLASVASQTLSPQDVIIVDNGSVDRTRQVVAKYNKFLPIRSIRESRIGIPYARNAALKIVKSDVVAFLDDDCIASPTWLSSIKYGFIKNPLSVGFIGNTSITNGASVPALVEFTYNRRWVLTHIKNPNTISKILSGVVVDFKNAAFRLKSVNHVHFSEYVPFGDVGNEDTEMGVRMFQQNQNIFYNPSMKAAHTYSPTVSRLLQRNFWVGYGDELLLLRNGVDLNITYSKLKTYGWISLCTNISKHLSVAQKVLFFLLIFTYPLASRVGGMIAKITQIREVPLSIPQR